MKIVDKYRNVIFYIVLALSFITIYIFSALTPIMSDDIGSTQYTLSTFGLLLRDCYEEYLHWNGRQVTHFIQRVFLAGPKWFFDIINSAVFVLTVLFMYFNVDKKNKKDIAAFLLTLLLVWKYAVSFGETILWEMGSCNYLFGAFIIIGFICLYRHHLNNDSEVDGYKVSVLSAVMLFILGVLAGWCNENSSGGCLVIVALYTFDYWTKKKKVKAWMVSGLLGNIVGLILLVIAPGNYERMGVMGDENHEGILKYVGRFLKIDAVFRNYFMIMLIIIGIAVIYGILKGIALKSYKTTFIFLVAGIATSFALIVMPPPMDRAHFCAGLFITVACVNAVNQIPKEDLYANLMKYSLIVVFLVTMYFEYISAGANLMRINRELQERERIVAEQVAGGQQDVYVPMIRPEWETRFTFIYKNDVEEKADSWGGYLYSELYGVNSVTGVPREEWDEEHQ